MSEIRIYRQSLTCLAILGSNAFLAVSALAGVSISFAPYFLYLSGEGKFCHGQGSMTEIEIFAN
jgi:hypothetical protein